MSRQLRHAFGLGMAHQLPCAAPLDHLRPGRTAEHAGRYLQRRGRQRTATREPARTVQGVRLTAAPPAAGGTGITGPDGDADAIYKTMAANLIANARFVPAGVIAVTRSQEYGYSLLYAG